MAGFIRDERGFPVGRIRDTLTVPPASAGALASKQLQGAGGRKTASPPVRDGVELVPNLTHIVNHDQQLYF